MRVLVACEFSGTVRDAFKRKGHDAWSCDLVPSLNGGKHYICDVLSVLSNGWDLMIAHPPCTHLAVSGARWFNDPKFPDKMRQQEEAIKFVKALLNAPIKRIAIENPVGVLSTKLRKPDQIIDPFDFGHGQTKKTCLWLKNLPLLSPPKNLVNTAVLEKPNWDQLSFGHHVPPSANRGRIRSLFFINVADAMAEQWSS